MLGRRALAKDGLQRIFGICAFLVVGFGGRRPARLMAQQARVVAEACYQAVMGGRYFIFAVRPDAFDRIYEVDWLWNLDVVHKVHIKFNKPDGSFVWGWLAHNLLEGPHILEMRFVRTDSQDWPEQFLHHWARRCGRPIGA